MCFGLILTGLSMSLLIVPAIPELIKSSQEQLSLNEETPSLCDKASAMCLTAQSLGYICGPILGGTLYDTYGFRGTSDILMISAVILSLLYYLVNVRSILRTPEFTEVEEHVTISRRGYKYTELEVHED